MADDAIAEVVYCTGHEKQHLPSATANMLQETADEFQKQRNFPNFVGAIEGKRAYQVSTNFRFSVL
jgi:hypothetical protein